MDNEHRDVISAGFLGSVSLSLKHRFVHPAPLVGTFDSAIHRINLYTVDKYEGNKLRYPLDGGLSSGERYPGPENWAQNLWAEKKFSLF